MGLAHPAEMIDPLRCRQVYPESANTHLEVTCWCGRGQLVLHAIWRSHGSIRCCWCSRQIRHPRLRQAGLKPCLLGKSWRVDSRNSGVGR